MTVRNMIRETRAEFRARREEAIADTAERYLINKDLAGAARDVRNDRLAGTVAAAVGVLGLVGTATGVKIDIPNGDVVGWAMMVGIPGAAVMYRQASTKTMALRRAFRYTRG